MRQLRRLFKLYQSFIASGLLIILSIILVVAGVIPAAKKTWETISVISQLRREIAGLRGKSAILGSLDEEQLTGQLQALVAAVPVDKSVQTLFSTVDGLANEAGVVLTDMSVANVGGVASGSAGAAVDSQKTGANTLGFTVLMQGELEQIVKLFLNSNYVRRLLRMKNFTFNLSSAAKPEARVVMETFFAPLPKKTVDGDLQPLTDQELVTYTDVSSLPTFAMDVTPQPVEAQSATTVKPDPFAP